MRRLILEHFRTNLISCFITVIAVLVNSDRSHAIRFVSSSFHLRRTATGGTPVQQHQRRVGAWIDTDTTAATSIRLHGPRTSPDSESTNKNSNKNMLVLSVRDRIQRVDHASPLQCDTDEDNPTTGTNNNTIRLVLASQSPRRKEILDMMGLRGQYETIPSPIDESVMQTQILHETRARSDPATYTRRLAEEKARAVAMHLSESDHNNQSDLESETIRHHHHHRRRSRPTLILGSDTVVAIDGQVLEKPTDATHARQMLQQLSGMEHVVHTGVALFQLRASTTPDAEATTTPVLVASFTDTAHVRFAQLSSSDIESYVNTGEPLDKAGSYGIQGIGGQLVTSIQGDFFTVMGLPMHRTSREIGLAVMEMLQDEDS